MAGELDRYFETWKRERVAESTRALQYEADRLQQRMRTPGVPPWMDRTRDARRGLFVRIPPVQGSHGYWIYDVEMGYDVQYGYWLELKRYDDMESGISKMDRAARVIGGFVTGDAPSQALWGRDSILLRSMPGFLRLLGEVLADVWSIGNVYGYEPRFSSTAGTSFGGQRAPGGDEGYDAGLGMRRRGYSGRSYMGQAGEPYTNQRDFIGYSSTYGGDVERDDVLDPDDEDDD